MDKKFILSFTGNKAGLHSKLKEYSTLTGASMNSTILEAVHIYLKTRLETARSKKYE